MERFNADRRIFCFILSTRSGGIGVNLTGADTVVFYDSDWNPTMDAQAQDRCHRIGQTRDVHIYRQVGVVLISERTVEENILKKANQKRMLGDLAIEGGNFTTAFFKQNTLKDLFGTDFGLALAEKSEESQKEDRPTEPERPEKFSSVEFEKALGMAEEELDVQAAHTARAEAAAELAEFDESIPLDTDSRDEDKSQAEEELDKLMDQLTPVERYAMQFLESLQEPLTLEQLKQAEEEIEAQKKDWELGRLKAIKEEEERRAGYRDDEEAPALVYSREDAYTQIYISMNGHEQMPIWAPPTPPQDENDLYIDYSVGFLYEPSVMSESSLPAVYIKKEAKRLKVDPLSTVTAARKQKSRKEDAVHIPKSLFDRPTAAILKMRREAKLQKVKNLMVCGAGQLPPKALASLPSRPLTQQGGFLAARPLLDLSPDMPEWLIHEDWAILQVIQQLQDIPLNLTVLSPGHTPNWDLVADVVNTVSRIYRSPKQCKDRYESVIVPREEGKILYDTNPKKQKKTKGIYKTKNNKPMRTGQLFSQDCNQAFTMLYNTRFDTIRAVASKRTPTLKPTFTANPLVKNPKHAAVLADNGISYDQPHPPAKLAAIRAERIAKEKQKSQMAAANVTTVALAKSGGILVSTAVTATTAAAGGVVSATPTFALTKVPQQSLACTVQTPVATLVKTVSAPSALGTSQTAVTIPVSAVTMAGVNINVSLAQAQLPTGKAPTVATQLGTVQIVQQGSGQGAKATTLPSATAITVQQIIKQVLPVNQNFLVSSAVQSAAGGSSGGATTVSPATQVQLHAMLHKPAVSTVALAAPTVASSGATTATLVPTRIMALQQPPGQPTAVALKQGLQVITASAGTAQTSSYTVEGSAATPLVASIVADAAAAAAALKPVEGGALPKAIAVAVTTATGADNSVGPPNVTAPSSSETITRAVSVDVSAATVQAVQAAIEAARQQGSLPYTMRLRNNPPKPA
ncbi:hypothetical protein HPB49_016936 [Dermacentor silvarum]|uniref:Uncharacterized protein n=1 Tax=Dermacentor silvarum TaxID=543639 RepID=A0ACB8D6N8_DERSI|nr:hypothetical protein HPB49_016936 [Dermacentor silvarum]